MFLTQEELKNIIDYNPQTGIFTWKVTLNSRACRGQRAGSLHRSTGRWRINIFHKEYSAHRLAFLYMEGYLPENFVDHKNRDPLDNSWNNLREVSVSCNTKNSKTSTRNNSGVVGVYWNTHENKWTSTIRINGKGLNLGSFSTKYEAVLVRAVAERMHKFYECQLQSTAEQYLREYAEKGECHE